MIYIKNKNYFILFEILKYKLKRKFIIKYIYLSISIIKLRSYYWISVFCFKDFLVFEKFIKVVNIF